MKKSHVFIARSILNRFSYKDNNCKMINYIDFNNNMIKNCPTKSFNTEKNYYTIQNEKILGDKIESKIGDVISKVQNQYDTGKNELDITKKDLEIIKNYIGYQLIRDDGVIDMLKSGIKKADLVRVPMSNERALELYNFKSLYSSADNRDIKNSYILFEDKLKIFGGILEEYGIVFNLNRTNIRYLLCNTTNTSFPESKEYFIIKYSLSPNVSVFLCNRASLYECFNTVEDYYIIVVNDESVVKDYNEGLYYTAKRNSPHILIGDKDELYRLLMADNGAK